MEKEEEGGNRWRPEFEPLTSEHLGLEAALQEHLATVLEDSADIAVGRRAEAPITVTFKLTFRLISGSGDLRWEVKDTIKRAPRVRCGGVAVEHKDRATGLVQLGVIVEPPQHELDFVNLRPFRRQGDDGAKD